jgi:putative intracellular protease/amidase/YHS domain-containing protein
MRMISRTRSLTILTSLLLTGLAAHGGGEETSSLKLSPPPSGPIPVAFLLSEHATMIDFAGPWEVFQDVLVPGRGDSPEAFRLFTVAETMAPIHTSGGMMIVPNYTLANAPVPKVIVIPAQSEATDAVRTWLRKSAPTADVVMSVCTGAFVLASTGLLDGQAATTHHSFYHQLATDYPKVKLEPGKRFVEGPKVATAGGLTSGIDLALRVVERYFGRDTAERTARYMEYQSGGWRDPTGAANAEYATSRLPPGTVLCAVCHMEVPEGLLTHRHDGRTYNFCSSACRTEFVSHPEKYTPPAN